MDSFNIWHGDEKAKLRAKPVFGPVRLPLPPIAMPIIDVKTKAVSSNKTYIICNFQFGIS